VPRLFDNSVTVLKRISRSREVREDATIEAKSRSTQESTEKEVASDWERGDDDDRTQSWRADLLELALTAQESQTWDIA